MLHVGMGSFSLKEGGRNDPSVRTSCTLACVPRVLTAITLTSAHVHWGLNFLWRVGCSCIYSSKQEVRFAPGCPPKPSSWDMFFVCHCELFAALELWVQTYEYRLSGGCFV